MYKARREQHRAESTTCLLVATHHLILQGSTNQELGGMQSLADEGVSHDMDREPLRQYDSELDRIRDAVDEYAAEPTGNDDDELHAVPTEVLQEDLEATIELPANFRTTQVSMCVADRPMNVFLGVLTVAAISTLWLSATPGDKFSVDDNLFVAADDPDVRHFYELSRLDNAYKRWTRNDPNGLRARQLTAMTDDNKPDTHESVTLVYERRGIGTSDMLSLRQIKVMHDFERQLHAWATESGVCWKAPGGGEGMLGCRPVDSLLNYLYPTGTAPTGSGGYGELALDGNMAVEHDSGCALPPFDDNDVSEMVDWLEAQGSDGFLAYIHDEHEDHHHEHLADPVSTSPPPSPEPMPPPPPSPNTPEPSPPPGTRRQAAVARQPPPSPMRVGELEGPSHTPSKYLRSTLYVDKEQMDGAKWYELASILYVFSSHPLFKSWYVHLYFGGPLDLMTAELLVLLVNDLFLIGISVGGIALYMRAYFGQWRLAGLAALQILLSFPIMYFVVCVLLQQQPLSAFAAASLAVVVGVSADNIFVLHETWAQSRMLRIGRQHAGFDERIEWTIRQAGVPLFFANFTTAASLFVNCFSPIQSITQFGLCGGMLIFINFGLALTYLPAVLVLEERGVLNPMAPTPDPVVRDKAQRKKMASLQTLHRSVWDRRSTILGVFASLVVFLTPFALTLSPGADSSFTLSPDPNMARIVAQAKLPPTTDGHLFRSAESNAFHATRPGEHGMRHLRLCDARVQCCARVLCEHECSAMHECSAVHECSYGL